MSCPKMEKLRFDVRVAEAEGEQQHSARRLFLESSSRRFDVDSHLLAFIEDLVVEAEMKRTRTSTQVASTRGPMCSFANLHCFWCDKYF